MRFLNWYRSKPWYIRYSLTLATVPIELALLYFLFSLGGEMSAQYYPARMYKKFETHAFAIPIDLFKAQIGVFFSAKDVCTLMAKDHGVKLDPEEFAVTTRANAEAGYIEDENGLPYFYMLFKEPNPPIGVVAHEAVHVANVLCERMGVPTDTDSDETFAYMVDFIVQSTVDEIIQWLNKDKDNG